MGRKTFHFVVWRGEELNKSIMFLEFSQASLLPSSDRKRKKYRC
jgi:hypothetical protein